MKAVLKSVFALSLLGSHMAYAVTSTWTGTVSNDMSNGGNWLSGSPPPSVPGDRLVFPALAIGHFAPFNTALANPFTVSDITISAASGHPYILSPLAPPHPYMYNSMGLNVSTVSAGDTNQ